MKKHQPSKVNSLPALLFWGLVWALAAWIMDKPLLLPTPVQVLRCMGELAVKATFWQTTLTSIGRIAHMCVHLKGVSHILGSQNDRTVIGAVSAGIRVYMTVARVSADPDRSIGAHSCSSVREQSAHCHFISTLVNHSG